MSSSLFRSAKFITWAMVCVAIPGMLDLGNCHAPSLTAISSRGTIPAQASSPEGKPHTTVRLNASPFDQGTRITVQLSAPLQLEMRQEELRVVLMFGKSAIELSNGEFNYKDNLVTAIVFEKSPAANQLSIQLSSKNIQTRMTYLASQNVYSLELRPQDYQPESKESVGSDIRHPNSSPTTEIWRHITIDAGHGGQDKGTMIKENLFEKDVTLAISKKLRWALQTRLGISVVLSRTEDQTMALEERVSTANQARSDLLVSIHIGNTNVARKPSNYAYVLKPDWEVSDTGEFKGGQGTRRLFIPWEESQRLSFPQSLRLADLIQNEMNRSFNGGDYFLRYRQVSLRLLAHLAMPAVLVEIGDASSPEFKEQANDNSFQNLVAATISIAIEKFHSVQRKP
jgi:N-acetylmuramoyl-L-alanine amidase